MPTLQTAVVVADGVQVVQEVQRVAGGQAGRLLPGRPGVWPGLGTSASLGHMGSHVKAAEWKLHQRGELVSSLAHLTEPFEVDDEYVRQGPQTQLHRALLEDFAVGAPPRIILGQLLLLCVELKTLIQGTAVLLVGLLLPRHTVRVLDPLLWEAPE